METKKRAFWGFLMALFMWSTGGAGGGSDPDPWPTVARHFTTQNLPAIAESLIASSCVDAGDIRHCVWPSWDGQRFQLAHSVRTDGNWSAVVAITNTTGNDNLQPRLALNNGAPTALYTYGNTIRRAVKGATWTTAWVLDGAVEGLAVHQEGGVTWWTWRDDQLAKWIVYDNGSWSNVGSRQIGADGYTVAVAAIRQTVLGL